MPRRGEDPDIQIIQLFWNRFLSLPPLRRQLIVAVVLIAAIMIGFLYWQQMHPPGSGGGGAGSPQMLLGNPSKANSSDSNNYLMLKPYYALSYNDADGIPNWVSWRVTQADLGTAPRKPTFDADTTLPLGFNVVAHKDYSGSGFDRGHLCPHSDRAANEEMSFATFVMTNIIPQAPNVNRKAWAQLEMYGRELVSREHDRLYIISGPTGHGGRGSKGPATTIGHGKVSVPAECWKIIVVLPDDGGDDDLAKINASTRVIAVVMPNDNDAVGEEWAGFRVSPAEIERKTGYRFFDRVSGDMAERLRQHVDQVAIAPPRPMVHHGD